jgi:hypothetical protein
LKGIEYEYRPVNLIKNGGEQVSFKKYLLLFKKKKFVLKKFGEEFTKINPKQEVPAILIDNNLLVQSVSIEIIIKIFSLIMINELQLISLQ